jgi:hypothetical protein
MSYIKNENVQTRHVLFEKNKKLTKSEKLDKILFFLKEINEKLTEVIHFRYK